MNQRQSVGRRDRFVRQYDYDDRTLIAADLNVPDDAIDVDVIGTTAIVVMEDDDGVREMEFELPGPAATVETRHGVLTITIERTSEDRTNMEE